MTETELKAFMQGVVVSNEGKIIISKTTVGNRIANIDYGEKGSAIVTYTDGSVINIDKVKTDDYGKITRIYMSANGETKYIDCTYDNDYLKTVGDIRVDDVKTLGITTNFNLQEKTVTPTTKSQTVTSDTDYDGLSSVVVNGDENLIPENIKKGVTIFDILGTLAGSGGGIGEDMEFTTLWEGVHEGTDNIQLSDSVLNYDFIIIELSSYYSSSDTERVSNKYEIIPKDKITINEGNHLTIKYQVTIFFNTNYYKTYRFGFETETCMVFSEPNGNWKSTAITGVYGIKFGGGSSNHTYSTEEQVIGTWIDGKPIYEKTLFIADSISNTEIQAPSTIENVDTVIELNGVCKWNDGNSYTFPIPYLSKEFNQAVQLFYKYSTKSIHIGTNLTITNVYTTMKYTKTTD